MEKLRQKLVEVNVNGFLQLTRQFNQMDKDKSGVLDFAELKAGFRSLGLSEEAMSDTELVTVFKELDENHSRSLNLNEFLKELTPSLSAARKKIIREAFEKADKTGDGVLTPADLQQFLIAKYHPLVKSGKMTEEEVKIDFLKSFEPDTESRDSKVTLAEFEKYYAGLSLNISSDDQFAKMISNTWGL